MPQVEIEDQFYVLPWYVCALYCLALLIGWMFWAVNKSLDKFLDVCDLIAKKKPRWTEKKYALFLLILSKGISAAALIYWGLAQ